MNKTEKLYRNIHRFATEAIPSSEKNDQFPHRKSFLPQKNDSSVLLFKLPGLEKIQTASIFQSEKN